MALHKHKPTDSGQAKPASSLHEAAVTLGSAGGKRGGPARAVKLTQSERTEIATKGGQARGRQEGKTGSHGQVTRKAATINEQGPPRQGPLGGPQGIQGPPRGVDPPMLPQASPNGLRSEFNLASRAMGRPWAAGGQ